MLLLIIIAYFRLIGDLDADFSRYNLKNLRYGESFGKNADISAENAMNPACKHLVSCFQVNSS